MRIPEAYLNSKFEYKLPDDEFIPEHLRGSIVDLSKNEVIKTIFMNSLAGGSDGISGFTCSVSGKSLFLFATTKLARMYNPEFENLDELTEEEIENEDSFFENQNA